MPTDIDNDIYILVSHENDQVYSDIGGKTENCDKNIHDTILREVTEETNAVLFGEENIHNKEEYMKKCNFSLQKLSLYLDSYNLTYFYNKKPKYLLYLIELDKKFMDINDFGEIEFKENKERKIEWIKYTKSLQLHPRLRYFADQIDDFLRSQLN